MPLDIRSRAVLERIEFDLVDETDAPLLDENGRPCRAAIYGPGSKRYVQAQARRQSRLLAKLQRGKQLAESGDQQLRSQAEFLADITDTLDLDYADDTGALLTGRDKLLAIYGDPGIGYIAEQVNRKAGDWGNFSKGSPKP